MKEPEDFVESIFTDGKGMFLGIICGYQMMNQQLRLSAVKEQRNTVLAGMPIGISTPRLFADFFQTISDSKKANLFLSLFRTRDFIASFIY